MRSALVLPLLLTAGPLLAQTQSEYVLYGGDYGTTPTTYEIRRTLDLDGDGSFLSPGEGVIFAADGASLVTYVEHMKYREYNTVPSVFGLGGGDTVIQMIDLDGDGVAMSPGEVNIWADTRAAYGVTNTSPDDLAFDPNTGVLYVCDDFWISGSGSQLGNGISAYTDLDGDGYALSPGEMTQLVDGQGALTVPGSGGVPVSIDLGDFEALTVDGQSTVIAFEQQDLVLYAFQDQNGDGDAMDPGEAWNFCNLVGNVPGLDMNVDVAAGILPNPSCPSSSGTGLYASLESLSVEIGAGQNGNDVYWIASTASGTCATGAGFVFRGEDLNGDGDLNDAGEVVMYLDPNNPFMMYPPSFIHDGQPHDGGYSIFEKSGPLGQTQEQNSVYFLQDLNGDGDASDSGEQLMRYFWDPDGCYGVSLAVLPKGAFSDNQPFVEFLGTSGTTSNGTSPAIGTNNLPALGSNFQVTLTNGTPSTTAVLLGGFSDSYWAGPPPISLPYDLASQGAPGNTLYVSPDYRFPTATNPAGAALMTVAIPNFPSLKGRDFYMQWYMVDTLANPRGVVLSDYLHGIMN